jgi:hypothetical protein
MTKLTKADLALPAALLALSFVPIVGGIARLASLAGSTPAGPDDARFAAAPAPVLIHVVAATVYALLGAFQFSTGIRQRWTKWHRRAGVLLLGCGFLVAGSGVWMTVAYPIPRELQGPLLIGVRLLVGVVMLVALAKGWGSILRRDVARHEAWMMRAYALAQGAGTQALLLLPPTLVTGPVLGLPRDIVLSAAWALNIGVVEWVLRRRRPGVVRAAASQPRAFV